MSTAIRSLSVSYSRVPSSSTRHTSTITSSPTFCLFSCVTSSRKYTFLQSLNSIFSSYCWYFSKVFLDFSDSMKGTGSSLLSIDGSVDPKCFFEVGQCQIKINLASVQLNGSLIHHSCGNKGHTSVVCTDCSLVIYFAQAVLTYGQVAR